jgi:uroporphyrinogen decarboxylase
MERRQFIRSAGIVSGVCASGLSTLSCRNKQARPVNKREAVLGLIQNDQEQEYYPGGFFIHFPGEYHFGEAAIDKHLEYFRYTGLDFIKIQYENTFPHIPAISKPSDWADMPLYKKEFYENQLAVIEGIIKKAKNEAPVIATFYSPYACAGHTITDKLLTRQLEEDPEQVRKGLEIITESLMIYVKECIRLGVDGFLQSTQGGEAGRFSDDRLFTEYVKPFDLQVGKVMEDNCPCNILHICDYLGNYENYSAFLDYPGHIVNSSLQLVDRTITTKEMYALFERPFMGGMDRKGIMAGGSPAEISVEVNQVLSDAPEKFVLGASCTLPGDVNWDNIKTALETAHNF